MNFECKRSPEKLTKISHYISPKLCDSCIQENGIVKSDIFKIYGLRQKDFSYLNNWYNNDKLMFYKPHLEEIIASFENNNTLTAKQLILQQKRNKEKEIFNKKYLSLKENILKILKDEFDHYIHDEIIIVIKNNLQMTAQEIINNAKKQQLLFEERYKLKDAFEKLIPRMNWIDPIIIEKYKNLYIGKKIENLDEIKRKLENISIGYQDLFDIYNTFNMKWNLNMRPADKTILVSV
jgi:hypothetical protein